MNGSQYNRLRKNRAGSDPTALEKVFWSINPGDGGFTAPGKIFWNRVFILSKLFYIASFNYLLDWITTTTIAGWSQRWNWSRSILFYQRSSFMNLFVLHSLPHCVRHIIKNILFSFLAPLLEAIFLSSFHLLKCPCFYLSVYLFPCSSLASHLGQFVFVSSNWKMMNNFLLFQFLAARCS